MLYRENGQYLYTIIDGGNTLFLSPIGVEKNRFNGFFLTHGMRIQRYYLLRETLCQGFYRVIII